MILLATKTDKKLRFLIFKFFLIFFLSNLGLSFAQNKEVKEVICDGYGRDVNEAAQNCAENALTNVVGSFIDANNSLEVRTSITNSIKTQTKFIKKDIKEYSQGVIQRFEIFKISTEKLYKVSAKVTVRIEDFKFYIKNLAEADVIVNEGLFAQINTEKNKNTAGGSIVYERILSPLVNGEVIEFKLNTPKPLNNFNFNEKNITATQQVNLQKFIDENKDLHIIGIEVKVKIKNDFLSNTKKILESIAKKKVEYGTLNQNSKYAFQLPINENIADKQDVYIVIAENNFNSSYKDNVNGYLINSIKNELENNNKWLVKFGQSKASGYAIPTPKLKLTLYDGSKTILQQEKIKDTSFRQLESTHHLILGDDYEKTYNSQWLLIGGTTFPDYRYETLTNSFIIRDSSNFILLIAVNENTLKNAKSINLKISD